MTIRDQVGAELWEQIKTTLESCYPDTRSTVSDAMVDELFRVAKHEWKAARLDAVSLPAPQQPTRRSGASSGRQYLAFGTHTRLVAPGHSFTGELPMVRVTLPESGTSTTTPVIETDGGDCHAADRLFPSVDVLWGRYRHDPLLAFERPERVDLVTPPRLMGGRFAAIAIYLAYAKASDAAPSFYVLEAGLATGQPAIAYLGRTMDAQIVTQSHYRPTPFSALHHWYRGTLTMCPGVKDDPKELLVEVFEEKPPKKQYIEVRVRYERRDEPVMTNPFHLTIAAGARLSAIADALGVEIEVPQRWLMRWIAADNQDRLFTTPPQRP